MSKESLLQSYRARQGALPAATAEPPTAAGPPVGQPQQEFRYQAAIPGAAATGAAYAYPLIGLPSLLMRGAEKVGEAFAPLERAAGAPARAIRGLFGMEEEQAPPEWVRQTIQAIQQAPETIGGAVTEMFGGSAAPQTVMERLAVAAAQGAGAGLPGLARAPGAFEPVAGTFAGELGVGALSGLAAQTAQESGLGPTGQMVAGVLPYALMKSTTGRGVPAERSMASIRQSRGLPVSPTEPLPKSAIAAALQADVKAARQAAAAPISAEFERIIGTMQDQPIMVRQNQYRDLVDSTEQLLDYLRTSVPKELQELILNSPSGPTGARSVAEGLRPFQQAMLRGEVSKTLDARQLYDFSEAVQSVLNKVRVPGDKRSLFTGIKAKADALLERIGPEFDNLQKARADWAKMKRTYDSNSLVGRLLRRDVDPEQVMEGIKSGTRAKYIRDALGDARLGDFQDLLIDELTRADSAAEALAKLKGNEKYKFALGDDQYGKLKNEIMQAARQEKLTGTVMEWIDKTLGGKGTNALIAVLKGTPTAITKTMVKGALEQVGTRLSTFQLNKLLDSLKDPNVVRFLVSQTAEVPPEQQRQAIPATELTSLGAVPGKPRSPGASKLLERYRMRQAR